MRLISSFSAAHSSDADLSSEHWRLRRSISSVILEFSRSSFCDSDSSDDDEATMDEFSSFNSEILSLASLSSPSTLRKASLRPSISHSMSSLPRTPWIFAS